MNLNKLFGVTSWKLTEPWVAGGIACLLTFGAFKMLDFNEWRELFYRFAWIGALLGLLLIALERYYFKGRIRWIGWVGPFALNWYFAAFIISQLTAKQSH